MLFDPFHHFTPPDFVFKIARSNEESRGYWALRRAIFCDEQRIFTGSDCDAIDDHAIPIVANRSSPEWRTRWSASSGLMSGSR